jgi:acyl-CoA synthetase (AMP-forming)/AMP-acid ligase II
LPSIFDRVLEIAAEHPSRPAIRQRGRDGQFTDMSYGELARLAREDAVRFHREGADIRLLPIYAAKSGRMIAAMLGALGAGKGFASLNPKLRAPQVGAILKAAKAPVAIIDGPGALALTRGPDLDAADCAARWWILDEETTLPMHERAIERLREHASVEAMPATESAVDDDFPAPGDDPQRAGCCLFTSGSTGAPKGVLISEHDLRRRAATEVVWYELTPDDVLINVLPFSFDVGLNQLCSSLWVGCTIVLLDSWLPADILNTAEAAAATGISAVPSIWQDFINAGLAFDTSGRHSAMRYITVSGGDLSPHQLSMLPGITRGAKIFKTYGQTEAFRATSLAPSEFAAHPESVGRQYLETKVYVVRENGTLADPNEVGEVVHSGLGVMLGYLDGTDPQNKLRPNPFLGPDDDSPYVVFTGDHGYLDNEGYLHLRGRRDAMLKIAGNRVYPGEITDQLLRVEGVAQAEIVGLNDAEDNTRLFAFVVLDHDGISPGDIRRQLGARVPSYMVPAEIQVMSGIPRTVNGKPDRTRLIKLARQSLNAPHQHGPSA